jgi:uncharacterized protein (TIGR02757 family)
MPEVNLRLLKSELDSVLKKYYNSSFIYTDPVSIPHQFSLPQDIEIAAFFTAMISWGNRKSIINNAIRLLGLMDNAPYDFIINHKNEDLKQMSAFVHRTFQYTDLLGFIAVLKNHYTYSNSLETAFISNERFINVKESLIHFHNYFFKDENIIQNRTKKHISTPEKKSACKRLNMFLRWMVRKDDKNIDFGLWHNIPASKLMIPLDIHVHKVAINLNLINRQISDWQTVEELTEVLKKLDKEDPIKYDYALFCLGLHKK